MIWKILKQHIKLSQLAVIFFSFLFGVTIIGAGVLFFRDQQMLLNKSNYWDSQYIAINKKVSIINTAAQALGASQQNTFSEAEIADLQAQTFVHDVASFTPCTFTISASASVSGTSLETLLFLESVPDKWIDVQSSDWHWTEGQTQVPVIMPKQYLDLYNFSFAGTQGLPQISTSAASAFTFSLDVYGRGMHQRFAMRVVGFSEKINTLLAPQSFVDWGNATFGDQLNPSSGHLLVQAKTGAENELLTYIQQKNYDLYQANVDSSTAMSILRILTVALSIIGIMIALLALILMIVSMQLLLHRNSESIYTLSILGFSVREVSQPYVLFISLFFAIIGLIAIICIALFSHYLDTHILLVNNITGNGLATAIATTVSSLTIGIVIIIGTTRQSIRNIFTK